MYYPGPALGFIEFPWAFAFFLRIQADLRSSDKVLSLHYGFQRQFRIIVNIPQNHHCGSTAHASFTVKMNPCIRRQAPHKGNELTYGGFGWGAYGRLWESGHNGARPGRLRPPLCWQTVQ